MDIQNTSVDIRKSRSCLDGVPCRVLIMVLSVLGYHYKTFFKACLRKGKFPMMATWY